MKQNQPLKLNSQISQRKPENVVHLNNRCPFCDTNSLTNILASDNDIIWLENKYHTLENTWQTVIIESGNHFGDISNYSQAHNHKLFAFTLACWQKAAENKKFKSILLFKNHGPLSGGSLGHPHLQLVGLEQQDGYSEINSTNFQGTIIAKNQFIELNISAQPIMGSTEFNLIINATSALNWLADYTQVITRYIITSYFQGKFDSYNLFFYHRANQIICKVVPRFIVTPYFAGYKIAQVDDEQRTDEIKLAVQGLLRQRGLL
ncbi:DUF4931 domain-containing protein [Loigolactobacillus iwatensis]|uniref:DUF4931 domain-containing protein n=1 Tax=Loigolactobacillus iwatensis TaxID=1267156 RepID=UPI000F7D89C0|nr:DUF4931 domain-containing protein [Loigolactobacillus iwatensis]